MGFALGLVALPAAAEESPPFRVGVELDPLPFFSGGDSEHAEFRPGASSFRFTLGMFGGSSDANIQPNARKHVRAYETSVQWFFVDKRTLGLFTGAYFFLGRERYEWDGPDGVSAPGFGLFPTIRHQERMRDFFAPCPTFGARRIPFGAGPYVAVWIAGGLSFGNDIPDVGDDDISYSGVMPFLETGVHLGVELPL